MSDRREEIRKRWPCKVETHGGDCYHPTQVEKWRDEVLAQLAERDALLERLCVVERTFNDDARLDGYFDVEIEKITEDYRKLKEGR